MLAKPPMSTVDLGATEQLVDVSRTRAIGDGIYYATKYMDGKKTLRQIVGAVLKGIKAVLAFRLLCLYYYGQKFGIIDTHSFFMSFKL